MRGGPVPRWLVGEYGEGVAEDFVGQNVALWRRRRDMTQQVLADLCGVSQAYVSMLERGQRAIDKRSTVIALAEALRRAWCLTWRRMWQVRMDVARGACWRRWCTTWRSC